MKIQVRLFAAARQLCDASMVEVELPAGSNVGKLRTALAEQYPALAPLSPHSMFAAASEYLSDQAPVAAGVEIACIPPVSGG